MESVSAAVTAVDFLRRKIAHIFVVQIQVNKGAQLASPVNRCLRRSG